MGSFRSRQPLLKKPISTILEEQNSQITIEEQKEHPVHSNPWDYKPSISKGEQAMADRDDLEEEEDEDDIDRKIE